MASAQAPWFLFGVGAVIAVCRDARRRLAARLRARDVPPDGGQHAAPSRRDRRLVVKRPTGDKALERARGNRGTLIASGFIAGGALVGVFDAVVKVIREAIHKPEGALNAGYLDGVGNWIGLFVFLGLSAFLAVWARRAKPEEGAGPQIQM